MENGKIRFQDLSVPLKIAIVGGMTFLIIATIQFIFGFLQGVAN